MRTIAHLGNGSASAPASRAGFMMLVFAFALGLSACGDEAGPGSRTDVRGKVTDAHKVTWLELRSPITPAQWLVSRDEAKARSLRDPDVQRVTGELERAHAIYRESSRMIANRAMQVSDMLAGIGIAEPPTVVLSDLTAIAGEVGQTEGFGGVAQHYFNLRAARVARDEALAALKARYGPRSKT
jgi:hypothetical protein